MVMNLLVCRKETFLEIVNSVPRRRMRMRDVEDFFKNILSAGTNNLLDLIFITILLVIFVKLLGIRRIYLAKKAGAGDEELLPLGESEQSGTENVENSGVVEEEGEGQTLEVEEIKRKKVKLVKRKSVSAAPDLNSYRLRHAKPKLKLLRSLDIVQNMFVFLFCFVLI